NGFAVLIQCSSSGKRASSPGKNQRTSWLMRGMTDRSRCRGPAFENLCPDVAVAALQPILQSGLRVGQFVFQCGDRARFLFHAGAGAIELPGLEQLPAQSVVAAPLEAAAQIVHGGAQLALDADEAIGVFVGVGGLRVGESLRETAA